MIWEKSTIDDVIIRSYEVADRCYEQVISKKPCGVFLVEDMLVLKTRVDVLGAGERQTIEEAKELADILMERRMK